MKTYINKITGAFLICCLFVAFTSCSDDDGENTLLRNQCLKRTLGPNVAGLDIYFSYAMAVPYDAGKLLSAQVEASIAGAEGTWMEHRSYHIYEGKDSAVVVGNPSINEGKKTKVEFVVDTCAATLRYYYKIPDEARGKSVTFTFSAEASTGETVSMTMGPYQIAKMEMKRDIQIRRGMLLTQNNFYISIEDMAAYTKKEAIQNPDKINLVYVYRDPGELPGVTLGHTFVAPAAYPNSEYFGQMEIPAELYRDAKIRKEYGLIDAHLTSDPDYGTYIDDMDFETLDLSNMPNYAVNLKKYGGMWVETEDGKYRAYIHLNSTMGEDSGVDFSIKRYTMR